MQCVVTPRMEKFVARLKIPDPRDVEMSDHRSRRLASRPATFSVELGIRPQSLLVAPPGLPHFLICEPYRVCTIGMTWRQERCHMLAAPRFNLCLLVGTSGLIQFAIYASKLIRFHRHDCKRIRIR
jgi:hypothetical protein